MRDKKYWIGLVILLGTIGSIYLSHQVMSIYGGDAGDLAGAIITKGIAHPPGYPFYTILGIILNKIIPVGTIAWKLGFLSSLPQIAALILLYDLLVYLSKQTFLSVIAVLVASFLYPLWLYGEVVEVFSLNNFFMITLLWLMFHFWKEKKEKYIYLLFFVFGLSITHHHIILFLLPALFYLLIKNKNNLNKVAKLKAFLLFFLGLTPYLYPIISASANPALNWQGPPTLVNFVNLATRAGYGTFTAGSFIAHHPFLRLLDIWAFFDFVHKDFRPLGLILIFVGAVYLYIKEKIIFKLLFIGFFSYIFFLFYASFPLVENFMVGTFERFVAPLYIFLVILVFYGLYSGQLLIMRIFQTILNGEKIKTATWLVNLLFMIYPLGLLTLNYPKISILKNDFTAENLGRDILNSVAVNSILIISTDTPLFNTQYVYYSEKKWPEVKLIHFTKLFTPDYHLQLKKYYPDLEVDLSGKTAREQFQIFIDKNYDKFPILSKLAFDTANGEWIPQGLLFRYYIKEDIPDEKEIFAQNIRLWNSYHDPSADSLSKFKNLILADALRIYALSHQEFGFWSAKRGYSNEAEKHLLEAERLYPDDLDSYKILSQVYILMKNCNQAAEQIKIIEAKDKDETAIYYLQSLNYAACFKDTQKASFYQKLYEEKERQRETPLRKL